MLATLLAMYITNVGIPACIGGLLAAPACNDCWQPCLYGMQLVLLGQSCSDHKNNPKFLLCNPLFIERQPFLRP